MAITQATPFLYKDIGTPVEAQNPMTLATSSGQGNIGPGLFLEVQSGIARRADENTAKAALLGYCNEILTLAGNVPVPNDYIANDTAGYATYFAAADLVGKEFLLGEDGVGTTIAAKIIADGLVEGAFYCAVINPGDTTTRVTAVDEVSLVMQLDSSSPTATQSNLWVRVLRQAPLPNPFSPTAPASDTSARNWICTIAL